MEYQIGTEIKYQGKTGIIRFKDEDGLVFESNNEKEYVTFDDIKNDELFPVQEDGGPVVTGEVVKLQKPNEEAYTNVRSDGEGNVIGDCTVCGADSVETDMHVCQTIITDPNIGEPSREQDIPAQPIRDIYEQDMVTTIKDFKKLFEGSLKTSIEFTDEQIKNLEKRFNMVHIKYHNQPFFPSIIKTLKDRKKLSERQWAELEFLLKNGQTRYEAGALPKNY